LAVADNPNLADICITAANTIAQIQPAFSQIQANTVTGAVKKREITSITPTQVVTGTATDITLTVANATLATDLF